MVQKILNSHKSVIFLNGDLPDVKEYYPYINDKIIITADGATTTLINNNIKVDYAIGDLDSICSTKNSLIGQIIKIDDQTNTDFEKCMDLCAGHDVRVEGSSPSWADIERSIS